MGDCIHRSIHERPRLSVVSVWGCSGFVYIGVGMRCYHCRYCLCGVGGVAYVYTRICMGGLDCRKCLSGVAGIGEDCCVQRL